MSGLGIARKVRVLLVDDSAGFRGVTRQMLEQAEDIEVVGEAADGLSCLEKLELLYPDVVLMDYAMLPMDGIEATTRVAATHPEVAVVGLSVGSESQALNRMREAGAQAVLLKGAGPDEICQAIRAAVRHNHGSAQQ